MTVESEWLCPIMQRSFIDFIQRHCCTPEALKNRWAFLSFFSWLSTWLTSLFSLLWGTLASVKLRPRRGVIETLFFADLWARCPWHNKQVIMPASCLTACCQEQFVLPGQRWCESWQVTLCQGRGKTADCSWGYRWRCFTQCISTAHFKVTILIIQGTPLSCFFFSEVQKYLLCNVTLFCFF